MERYDFVKDILFLDIETVSEFRTYEELPERFKKLWDKKSSYWQDKEEWTPAEAYANKAGIYSEFSKVIVISYGFFQKDKEDHTLFLHDTIAGHDEKAVLKEFASVLKKFCDDSHYKLCAHNGKEFDFPFLSRRMLVKGVPMPKALQINGMKPWDIPHLDTMKLWAFGDFKNYTSLETLAAVFNLPSSKTNLDGSQVHGVYYDENNLDRIATYCSEDVILTAMVYLKLFGYQELDRRFFKKL